MASTAQDAQAPLRGSDGKVKDDDLEDVEFSPFYGIEKGSVLQEARIFHQSNLDVRKCQQVITKLLYLQHQGESFSKKELSELFFGITKLFQSADVGLRRMVYLCLKDICPEADEVMIITNSLMKDMNSPQELYRANAIRVLRTIINASMLQQLERYFKQGVVDKSPVVASSALVAGLHLSQIAPEVLKRWASEIQEGMQSKHTMVQFHAIALQTALKSSDRLAISKILSSLTSTSLKSPMAHCMVIRYVSQVIKDTSAPADGEKRPFFDYLVSSLRHKSDMVMFQAARTIAELKDVTMRELAPAITVLSLFLSSSKPVLRFAAVRILNTVSMTHPMAVTNCNIELEALMTDTNRSIAVYAITTLLKTGSEANVERLLKQIRAFMADIADDFKVVVVDAIKVLCLKYPSKHRSLLNFLSHMLREEGGYEFKKSIVEAVLVLISKISDAREPGLLHLAEFIEDCEFTQLATQVLHLLGEAAPETSEPSRFVRFIYNRVILENATVRAAAVSSLASICASCPSLRERILVILRRSLSDNDDEVRDRCTLYLSHLEGHVGTPDMVKSKFGVPLTNLKDALEKYLEGPLDADFSIDSVDTFVEEPLVPTKSGKRLPEASAVTLASEVADFVQELEKVPVLVALGPRFRTCPPAALTEDTEYVVNCVKHVTENHIILHFNCINTIHEQVLEDVTMELEMGDMSDMELVPDLCVPLKRMPHSHSGSTFVVLERSEGALATGTATVTMHFTLKEMDVTTGEIEEDGYKDEYQLEDVTVALKDYVKALPVPNFKAAWDEAGADGEVVQDYSLGVVEGGVPSAVEGMVSGLGMFVAEGTDVVASNARSHTMMVAGEICGAHKCFARISLGMEPSGSVAMKVVSRSEDADTSQMLQDIIASSE